MPHGKPIDKYAASERTVIAGPVDASDMLRIFAYECAEDARQSAIAALRSCGHNKEAEQLAACASIIDKGTAADAADAAKASKGNEWGAAWKAAWAAVYAATDTTGTQRGQQWTQQKGQNASNSQNGLKNYAFRC